MTSATIVLHQFAPMYGLPNPSPFCIKLETYLRLAKLEYTVATLKGPPRSPTGKAPYIEIDGEVLCDSGLIVAELERRYGHPVDGKLTLSERAQSLAFQRMMEEHLYWAAVYARWLDPENAQAIRGYIRDVTGIPAVLMPIVGPLIQRRIKATLLNQGLGRHPPQTIWRLAMADVDALAHWLGQRPWAFGDSPTTVDAVMFAFIASVVRTPWDFPLKAHTVKHRNLVDHTQRMLASCFPELATS
ncbi:MAG: glutathione S-transferase family protein [Rhodobacteraceae bacterium]|nr:glutathione S-transferase family protein [Paracoccaceae bacterium]